MENWTIPGETEFHYATPADFEDFHIYKYDQFMMHNGCDKSITV
jgi:hypothetical protein